MCMKKADPKSSVCITNEYGHLRECIVGLGAGMEAASGLDWSDLLMNGEPLSEKLEAENSQLIDVLSKSDVKVVRPSRLGEKEICDAYGEKAFGNGFNQAFPRNNSVIVANDLIEFELQPTNRKTDILGLYGILQEKSRDSSICWYSTPHCPVLYQIGNYPSLDGADFVFLDDKMIIGIHEGDSGTNLEGFRWMRNTFAFHDVRGVQLPADIGSLGQVMSVIRPGLAVVCREIVRELPSYMNDWDIIDITADEARALAADNLSVDENTYIVGYSDQFDNSRLISELEKRKVTVIAIDFTAHMELGGSVRSAVMALRRDVPE